ncbi:symmetrical bis(5'-nucleosyl)-tetraphosphatase [Legionella sp. km772]|uniref:symmetrical bis(5'-nucleosyl)-tetraphosphatase n=1 Tax=Legionella sp. km772 TaxID=2498111 RepID=UPI000F8C3BF1|nr:symmetrical bis(5'-nucleosyl)-tetraphosphatase [Legionella sp. km772]RUR08466.1 symmetrical bis(5'-nucleosyl)-tetraphosphatase [Legionella sp. km772]
MADYAIGDIQGCYDPLLRLLDYLQFNEREDRLWFVGDLVNRGPQSLAVLRFIKQLSLTPRITLGNHDLHLLGSLFGGRPWKGHDDTIQEIIQADDGEELGHWLRAQSIIYYDEKLGYVMCHAGIAPIWDLNQALCFGAELERVLAGDDYAHFLRQMYGNLPNHWSADLQGIDRLRLITNYFTRMRFCDQEGNLDLSYKGDISKAPSSLFPWFLVPKRKELAPDILFGHWAALMGNCPHPRIHALDTGCLWGGQLTALRLQDKRRFSVAGVLN